MLFAGYQLSLVQHSLLNAGKIHQPKFNNRRLQLSGFWCAECVDCQGLISVNCQLKFFSANYSVMYVLWLSVSNSNLMACLLDFSRFSTSAVAVCISTCYSEASNVFSVMVKMVSVTTLAVSVGFSWNLLMQRLRWCLFLCWQWTHTLLVFLMMAWF